MSVIYTGVPGWDIDCGDLSEDIYPGDYVCTFDMEIIQRKSDKLPEVGGTIKYQDEFLEIVSVQSDEKFFTSRKTWSRSRAMWVRNKYRRVYLKCQRKIKYHKTRT